MIDKKRNSQFWTVDWSNWSTPEWNHSVKSVQIRSFLWSVFFGLNTERYWVSLRIQSECGKIRTRKNSVFGHFSRSELSEKKSVYNRELCICEITGTLMIKNSKCIICIKCIISKLKTSETYITNFAVLHEQKQPSRGVIIKVFWKYIANLQENTHAEVRSQ